MKRKDKLKKTEGGVLVFSKEKCDILKGLAAGLTIDDIADYFDISRASFFNIRKRQPEVDQAYMNGFAYAKKRALNKLMMYIDSPELNQVNLTATIFYLKTRGGWVDSSKFIEREAAKVRQDLIDIKQVEDPKEMLSKIDKAIAAIDFLMQKDSKNA